MSIDPEFARPEGGFDPTQNQIVSDMYPGGAVRAPLDPKGQRAPTVLERIDAAIKDFERLIGRPPDADERKRLEDLQIRCSGWLEGLKIDLEGATVVPLEYFNRLVEEQENTILYVTHDRVHSDALYIQKCLERDDEIGRLSDELSLVNDRLKEFEELEGSLRKEADMVRSELNSSIMETLRLQDQLEKLKGAPSHLDAQFDALKVESAAIKELERKNGDLQEELNRLKS